MNFHGGDALREKLFRGENRGNVSYDTVWTAVRLYDKIIQSKRAAAKSEKDQAAREAYIMLDIRVELTKTPKAKPADESKLGFGKVF